jgi:O-antigen/teichoic acid export membrane protein
MSPTRSEPARKGVPGGVRASFTEAFGFGVLSFVLGAVLGVVSSIVIARLYGIDVIGEFALATAPTGFVWFLSTVRERPALIRSLAKLPPRHNRVTGLFAAVFAFSAGLTALVAAIATGVMYLMFKGPIGQPQLFGPALANLVLYVVVINTCWNLDGVFSAFLAGRQLFWIRTQQTVCYVVFGTVAALVVAEPGVWSLIAALGASWLPSLLYRLVLVRRWMKLRVPLREVRAGFETLPEILMFGIKVTPGSLADGISTEAGTWILGIFSSVASVGGWNRAWTLGKRLVDLNYRMGEMLFPTLIERRDAGDQIGFDRALLDSLRYVSTGLLMPAAAAGGASVGIMELFGPGFSVASTALALTLLVAPMTAMLTLQTQALLAVDRPLVASGFSLVRLGVTLAASVPLTISLGVTGPALGVAFGCATQLAGQLGYLRRYLEAPVSRFWPRRSMIGVLVAYGAGFIAARGLDSALPGPLGLMIALIGGSAAYLACIAAVAGLLPRDRERLGRLAERFGLRSRPAGVDSSMAAGPKASESG